LNVLLLQQDSFSKYRGNMLLSASELDELSETETEASETESETSMEDPLAGSMSAGSTSCELAVNLCSASPN